MLALLAATVLVVGVTSLRYVTQSSRNDGWVRHTHEVLGGLQDYLAAMQAVESSYRGFVITGDEATLAPYRSSVSRADEATRRIGGLTVDNPVQQRRIPDLERLARRNFQDAEALIALRRSAGFAAAAASVRAGAGTQTMQEIQGLILQMTGEEQQLRDTRVTVALLSQGHTRWLLILGTALSLLIAAVAAWSMRRDSSSRARAEDALFDEKERAQVTLNSIGDAVVSTDTTGNIRYLNAAAGRMTGWNWQDAVGRHLSEVFRVVDATSRAPIAFPVKVAVEQNRIAHLPPNCILVRRGGGEAAIEDSAAPIHDRHGQVAGAVMVFHDVSAARAQALRMSHQAQHDSLTDLPNRYLLDDRLVQAIALAQRRQEKLALLFLDIDRFKQINDNLGHGVGDRLLQSVAQRLLGCVRRPDTVSRQGGDEFVILLAPLAHARDAAICADKILLALSAPHVVDENELHITVSIGIVTYPDDGTDALTLMKNADVAMYHAKDNGRDNFQFFESGMNELAAERQSLEDGLRHAVERRELVLHYQPKLDLQTKAVAGVEALVRWDHPSRGIVAPAQFIPIAEESGLIVPIGRWILGEACRQARAWQVAGLPPMRIAVNISAVQLRARDFVAGVSAALAEAGLMPGDLELELTETYLMQESSATDTVLQALKDLGVGLSLDDFGTGYSSLSFLRRFPIDTVKIDQSFVRDLTTDADDASIVKAVVSMGRSLNLRVIAEGVETREQVAFLQEQGCEEGQGYFFSRPLPADEFTRLLQRPIEETALA